MDIEEICDGLGFSDQEKAYIADVFGGLSLSDQEIREFLVLEMIEADMRRKGKL